MGDLEALDRMAELVVGMLGLGTVGSGILRCFSEAAARIQAEVGQSVRLKRIGVKDLRKTREIGPTNASLTDDVWSVVRDPEIRVILEVMGGVEPAFSYVAGALEAGKNVVTANKALLAARGRDLFDLARRSNRAIAFEAAVGGGIPIIGALSCGLAANQVQSVAGILNGTCNTILTSMTERGATYASALASAQFHGLAETDPTLDVDGSDTAHKLSILARIAFGCDVNWESIPRRGVDRLQPQDLRFASELGYVVKLLAIARRVEPGVLALRVAPALVKKGTPLAEVRGSYNAIRVVGDFVGDTLYYGPGAGAMPTASAVLGDLVDVAVGRAEQTARVLDRRFDSAPRVVLATPNQIRKRYYIRVTIADRPGVLGMIAQVFGSRNVSIASVIQHDPGDDDHPDAPVPLVLMSHTASEADIESALAQIDRLPVVTPPSVCFGVEE
jgi:homoserine dehydrogenase